MFRSWRERGTIGGEQGDDEAAMWRWRLESDSACAHSEQYPPRQ